MTLNDARKQYDVAWRRLFDLVKHRNQLLRQLEQMSNYRGDFSPATAMFMEFDIDKAGDILVRSKAMTPGIYAAVGELNHMRRRSASPE